MITKERLHDIIFESDTPKGKVFDVMLLWAIMISVSVVMLESVASVRNNYGEELRVLEWFFTILFSIEYITRIWVVKKSWNYVFSFYGIIDLLSILPTYLALFITGPQYLIVIRTIRLIRVFRVLKMTRFLGEANQLSKALAASRHKITVFLIAVLSIVTITGTAMFVIEGDIAPSTPLGQVLAAMIMIMGYAIIAVPTGIVTAELTRQTTGGLSQKACINCSREGHDMNAEFCKYCGAEL
jgi:voltage-gated potassium channel